MPPSLDQRSLHTSFQRTSKNAFRQDARTAQVQALCRRGGQAQGADPRGDHCTARTQSADQELGRPCGGGVSHDCRRHGCLCRRLPQAPGGARSRGQGGPPCRGARPLPHELRRLPAAPHPVQHQHVARRQGRQVHQAGLAHPVRQPVRQVGGGPGAARLPHREHVGLDSCAEGVPGPDGGGVRGARHGLGVVLGGQVRGLPGDGPAWVPAP